MTSNQNQQNIYTMRLININVHISLVLVQAPGHCYFSIKICSKIDCLCLAKLHFVMSKMIDFKIWNWIGYKICLLYKNFKIVKFFYYIDTSRLYNVFYYEYQTCSDISFPPLRRTEKWYYNTISFQCKRTLTLQYIETLSKMNCE